MVKRRGALQRPDLRLMHVLVDACVRERLVSVRGLVGGGGSWHVGPAPIIRLRTAVGKMKT
jgi:hypothetical protein